MLHSETNKPVKVLILLLVYSWSDQFPCSLLPGHVAKLHFPLSFAVRWGHVTSPGQWNVREVMNCNKVNGMWKMWECGRSGP